MDRKIWHKYNIVAATAIIAMLCGAAVKPSTASAFVGYDDSDHGQVVASINSSSAVFWGFFDSTASGDIVGASMWLQSSTTAARDLFIGCEVIIGGAPCAGWVIPSHDGMNGPNGYSGLVLTGTSTAAIGGQRVDFVTKYPSSQATAPFNPATQRLYIYIWDSLISPGTVNGYAYGNLSTNKGCSHGGSNMCVNGGNNAPYLQIYVDDIPVNSDDQPATQTRFTNNFAPAMYFKSPSNSVTIQQEYYYSGNEGYNRVGIILKDENTGSRITVPEETISGTGYFTFDTTLLLQASTTYTWRPYMYELDSLVGQSDPFGGSILDGSILDNSSLVSTSTTASLVGNAKIFRTSGTYQWQDSAIFGGTGILSGGLLDGDTLLLNEGNASTTLVSEIMTGYAMIDALATKFPFNWIIGGGLILSSLKNETATTSLPSMTVDFGYLRTVQAIATTTGPVNWSVDYIGSDDFATVAAFGPIIIARQMAVYILWIALFFFVLKEAMSIFGRRDNREYGDFVADQSMQVRKR